MKYTIYEKIVIEDNQTFTKDINLHDFARFTGLDVGYLSKVRSNKVAVSKAQYHNITLLLNKYRGLTDFE